MCYGFSPSYYSTSPGGSMAEILKLQNGSLDYALEYTVRLILSGKVVAFPTDTFYGLGADPFNLAAVSEIFRIKGRLADRPIPLLVDSIDQAAELAHHPPKLFFTLAEKFWPGALTLVVPASHQIPLKITANTGKVGLRWPLAPFVVALIAAAGRPLTGTSANLSDMESCSTADEVDCQIGDVLPLILDGGLTRGGLASTVVELTGETGRIVRQGGVPESELKEYLG
jgi:L-threonylcarbamoyladenylate synthase